MEDTYTNRPALLTIGEVSKVTSICKSKVYEMVWSGDWPSVRIGTAVRIPADALQAWIEAHTVSEGQQ
jgi:excisionase family DNA binding protein